MTEDQSLSSAASSCLDAPYPSSQKGGTLIVAGVRSLEAHEQRLCDPDGYRPAACPRCGAKLHVQDSRTRQLRNDEQAYVGVKIYRCADRGRCGAVWRVLPAFLARWLRRRWSVIEAAIEDPTTSPVPKRTCRRWIRHLARPVRRVVAALTTAADTVWTALATAVGLAGRCADLAATYRRQWTPATGWALAELSEVIHRLCPGLRLT